MQINYSNFILTEVPRLHPQSLEYRTFWREQKKYCIEGKWAGGQWCPPVLYFYLNFATILIQKGKNSKTQEKARPFNTDTLWELHYLWAEARGLSGFEKVGDVQDIRSFLQNTTEDLGRPLYNNPAKNLAYLTARGQGKSFTGANIAAHEFLFDGLKEYHPDKPITSRSEILIGAFDAKYSTDLCSKIKLTFDNLPGGIELNGVYYPPPFYKTLSGSWDPSKNIEHSYKKKIGNNTVVHGTRSVIKHRTYNNSPFAAQGGRNTVAVKEEFGHFDNVLEAHYADEYTQKIGNNKFGSTLYQGTGGQMKTFGAKKIFYDPEAYDCLSFEDKWEHKGKIGFFIPATYGKLDYKDEQGNTNFELAQTMENLVREEKKKARDSGVYDEYVVYNPLVPSEIFLQRNSNVFPIEVLAARLADLESKAKIGKNSEYIGDIVYNEELNKYEWRKNSDLRPIYDYPLDKGRFQDGAVVIYEHPYENEFGQVDGGRYIAGMDSYDLNSAPTSDSLGSLLVYDKLHERIVCEYTGRPVSAHQFYETARKVLKYYNAKCLYENQNKGFLEYMDRKNETWMLADQPKILKEMIPDSKVNREKGMHMVEKFKKAGLNWINTWLRSSAELYDDPEITKAQRLRCIPLIKELIAYVDDKNMNFDRVMAMVVLMFHIEEVKKYVYSEEAVYIKPIHQSDFFNRKLFIK